MIKRVEDNLVLDNGFVRIYNDKVLFNGGKEGFYFRESASINNPNYGVAIICEIKDNIILFENYRYAHQEFLIETVKGMGMKNKKPIEAAIIEIEEEVGGTIQEIIQIGKIKNDKCDTPIYCFHAKITELKETSHEDTEFIKNIKAYSKDDVKKMISNFEIEDTVTLSLLAKVLI